MCAGEIQGKFNIIYYALFMHFMSRRGKKECFSACEAKRKARQKARGQASSSGERKKVHSELSPSPSVSQLSV